MSESTSFVRLFVGFLLSATGFCCPIELIPSSVVVKYEDPVSINCSTLDPQHKGMGWEAPHGGTTVLQVPALTWALANVTDWNPTPECFINPSPEFGKQCSKVPDIIVYTFPETIDISSSGSSDGVVREGETYSLTCEIKRVAPLQRLTMRWYKDDTLFHTDTFDSSSRKPVDQSSVINFTSTRQDSGVTFRCEAHLDLSPDGPQLYLTSQEYNVTVYYGPEMLCSTVELLEGETIESYCPVKGNPAPIVTWKKDGQSTEPTIPLSRENAGWYTVEAEGISFIRKNLQVLVLYGPELTCPLNYTTTEYAPFNLTCKVEGYPKPEITLYKDNDEVELPENLTRSDSGQYVIAASNQNDIVNVTVEIVVTYPPSQILELEDTEVARGSTVALKCSSMGNPRPEYSWNYYRTDNVVEENEDGVSRLLILNATASNMGTYTCQASNMEGNVSKTVRVSVKGAKIECPLEINPDRMLLQYQGMEKNVTCKTLTSSENVRDQYWQISGISISRKAWTPDTQNDWDPSPACFATFVGREPCNKSLNFTLYKEPDSVSIRVLNNESSPVEGSDCFLRCDVVNFAPAQSLRVQWYQGNKTMEGLTNTSSKIHCPSSSANCDINTIKTPVNMSFTTTITLDKKHNGAEFRCKAVMDLELEDPPNMTSSPINVTVHYKPAINTTKLPKTIPVFRGYPEELVCEAEGNPPPKIQWLSNSDKVLQVSGGVLTVNEAGVYNCNASNDVDSTSHEVVVILKEDYLPLIAGFVAVTVVVISIVFLFIYSIYYKNTKMRHYNLKNPKLSIHNGNVAHNGWDSQFPMTKLSYRKLNAARLVLLSGLSMKVKGETQHVQIVRKHTFGNRLPRLHNFIQKFSFIYTCTCFVNFTENMMWVIVFGGFMALTGTPVGAQCPVMIQPNVPVVKFEDPLLVNCTSSTDQTKIMGWEAPYGGTRKEDVTSVLLNITSAYTWDLGPLCYITFLDGTQCEEEVPITVYQMPQSVSLSQSNQDNPMVEGKKYQMRCDIVNVAPSRNLSVYWHKGDKIIHIDTFSNVSSLQPLNQSSAFELTAGREDNGSRIWCEAALNFGPSGPDLPPMESKSHDMIVQYPPTFMNPEVEAVEVPADLKISLNCTATGNPLPVYRWSLPPAMQKMMANQPVLTLSVPFVGTYNCTASNSQGTRTKSFIVTDAPRDQTILAVVIGVPAVLGFAALITGLYYVKSDGTFCSKPSYQPASSGATRGCQIQRDHLLEGATMASNESYTVINTGWSLHPGLGHSLFTRRPWPWPGKIVARVGGPFCSNIVPCRVAKFVQVGIFSPSLLNRKLPAKKNNMENNFLKRIVMFCMFYTVSGEGCSLVLKPSRVVVGFGEPVTVSCEATRPVRVLGWESAIGAAHTQQDLSVQWKVDSLIDWIEEPICYGVFFTAPRQCEEKLNLVLFKTPDSVSIRHVNHTGPMVEGKEYQLLCEVQNIAPVQYLSLKWYRGQTEVYNHSFSDLTSSSPVQVSSILVIVPTKAENGAQYRCVAELELGPEGPQPPPTVTSEPLNASVYFPPSFISPEPEVVDLIEGAEIILNCTATGNPTPVYSWQSSHPMQDRFEDEAVVTSSSLLPGTYTCTASNTLEKKSKQFIVKPKTKGV
ncbi:hemicentin-1 [Sphaeramia orbicularis]|uniref:hemicentin-1 n=1 Tax=Sphaeramia orbicularis TaxID=375764 RepID=UPI00117FE907|nr:intercellular adhesion molecule 1 [Sphaeramia orbicularis]